MDFQIIEAAWGTPRRPVIPAGGVDLAFGDPPYNIGVRYEDDPTCDRLHPTDYWEWTKNALREIGSTLRAGGLLWWVCPEEHGDIVGPLLTQIIGPRIYRIIWHETFSQYNRYDLTQDYRFIFCHMRTKINGDAERWGRKINHTFNPDPIRVPSQRMLLGDKRAAGPRIPGRVWQLRRLQGTAKDRVGWHPAQMPPEVLERILLGWSNPGDTVLDAFAGSGSMGVQCLRHGRRFIGVDNSPTYCLKMRERLEKLCTTTTTSS